MKEQFQQALDYEIVTIRYAIEGFLIAFITVGIGLLCRAMWRKSALLSDPILVTAYTLPPFATVIAVSVLRLENIGVQLLVAAAVSYPLTVLLNEALDEGMGLASGSNCGGRAAKFFLITLPATSAGVIFAIGTCLPWILLAAMLAEIATATKGGMGIFLLNEIQKGKIHATPYLVVTALVSIVSYGVFIVAAYFLRRKLDLPRKSEIFDQSSLDADRSASIETIALLAAIVTFWAALNALAPVTAPTLHTTFEALRASRHVIVEAILVTFITTVASVLFGGCLGFVCALLGKMFPFAPPLFITLLFPLQIIPIIVFVPDLIAWELSLKHHLWVDAFSPPAGIVGLIPFVLPPLVIGVLAAGYSFYEIGKNQLLRLPIAQGALLETRGRSNLQIVKYIDLPWLLKAGWSALDVAMPRTLLAVLVTETLVTYRGLGGYLAVQRGGANFAEAWGALLLLLIIILVLRIATNPAVTRKLRS